jgi:HD-like signal output (HDOD) protein
VRHEPFGLFIMLDKNELLRAARSLKPLPESAVRLSHLVAEDSPDMHEISHVIEFDPVLTGAVIRVANSSACGGRVKVGSIREAVSRLGFSAILSLAVRAAMRGTLDRSLPEFGYGSGGFWAHCSASSIAAEALRRFCGLCVPLDAATAAMLHDIGKLVIAEALSPKKRAQLARATSNGALTGREAEKELLGVDHAEVGGMIVESWKVPENIQIAVACHHDPERGSSVTCDVVHLADLVANKALVGENEEPVCPEVRPDVLRNLEMSQPQVAELTLHVHATLKDLEEAYAGALPIC